MTDTAIAVQESYAPSAIIKTPLAILNEMGEFMAGSGPMVSPTMQGRPDRCRAVAYLADRWDFDPFFVASETFFFADREGKERMGFGAKVILALINARAPLQRPLEYEFTGNGAQLQCKVTGWLRGSEKPSVYVSPILGQINPRRSPLWTSDPQQQISYYSGRAWSRRYSPQTIGGVYDREELENLTIVGSEDAAEPRRSPYAAQTAPEHVDAEVVEDGFQASEFTPAVDVSPETARASRTKATNIDPNPWPDVEDIMEWLAIFKGEVDQSLDRTRLAILFETAKAHGLIARLKKVSATDYSDLIKTLDDKNAELKKAETKADPATQ